MCDQPFFDLERFVSAQDKVWPTVMQELQAGQKRSHWIWFVFPQLQGLGRSATAQFYGLQGAAEALAYWQHPRLQARLLAATRAVLQHPTQAISRFFPNPDDLKLCSSMTLFEQVAGEQAGCFAEVLETFYGGQRDPQTLEQLQA